MSVYQNETSKLIPEIQIQPNFETNNEISQNEISIK